MTATPTPAPGVPEVEAPEVDVIIRADAWEAAVPAVAARCRRWVWHALSSADGAGAGPVEVAVVLADDPFVQGLNRDYRGIDRPTNVLSFPAGDPVHPAAAAGAAGAPRLLGDVVIAFETTRDEAVRLGRPVADHLCHLVVHGILHLIGYDHETDGDAAAMERLETRLLAGLGVADPYATDDNSEG